MLLTGDNRTVAEADRRGSVGIADVRSDLLPADKVARAARSAAPATAMVGDGVNDAPALATADLGIAMGSAGSDTAIEVADVALMGDDPRKVAELIGARALDARVVRQNIAFSLGTKAIAAGFALVGLLPLWPAVLSDVGATLLVVVNGLRLMRSPFGATSDDRHA